MQKSRILPLTFLLLLLPIAVAGQNIGSAIAFVACAVVIKRRWSALDVRAFWREFRVPLCAALAYLVWGYIAGALNPASPEHLKLDFIGGYLTWALVPSAACLALSPLSPDEIERLKSVFAGVAVFWGLLAIGQALIGFKLAGMHFEPDIKRAQGLYSHPLSFAYASILLVPIGWLGLLREPKDWRWWAIAFGGVASVYASQSRTVQLVVAVAMIVSAFVAASGRGRLVAVAVLVIGCAIFAGTDNLMKDRFTRTMNGHFDVTSSYPDDRLAFWDVHWLMFKERPWVGHGENLSTLYRTPYFERLGLGSLERKYPAHNMYLQIAVNQGLVGLGIFAIWFAWHLRRAWRARRHAIFAAGAWLSLVVFACASVTQNSFQDAVVRYVLTVLTGALWFVPTFQSSMRNDRISSDPSKEVAV